MLCSILSKNFEKPKMAVPVDRRGSRMPSTPPRMGVSLSSHMVRETAPNLFSPVTWWASRRVYTNRHLRCGHLSLETVFVTPSTPDEKCQNRQSGKCPGLTMRHCENPGWAWVGPRLSLSLVLLCYTMVQLCVSPDE